jgi:alpha-tubulin suppressor-like RCC1 family protein
MIGMQRWVGARAAIAFACVCVCSGCPRAMPPYDLPSADAPDAMSPPGDVTPAPDAGASDCDDPMRCGASMAPVGGSGPCGPDGEMVTKPECPPDPMVRAARIELGVDRSCAITDVGTLMCWGRDMLGSEAATTSPMIVQGIGPVTDATLGWDHACAISDGRVYCFGVNREGALGDGTLIDRAEPTEVQGLDHVVDVDAGFGFTCAVRDDAELFCWGANDAGQLGPNADGDANEPVPVLSGVQRVSAGGRHACALLSSGRVLCWGDNAFGQLGNGTNQSSATPLDTGLNAIDLSVGYSHNCAVLDDRSVWCWGENGSGQLGDGTTGGPIGIGMPFGRTSPVHVEGVENAAAVHAGIGHTCAHTVPGQVLCWGSNQFDQLISGAPIGYFALHAEPATQLSQELEALAVSADHSCAMYRNAGAICWGSNQFGQLGDGTREDRFAPVAVQGLGCN